MLFLFKIISDLVKRRKYRQVEDIRLRDCVKPYWLFKNSKGTEFKR